MLTVMWCWYSINLVWRVEIRLGLLANTFKQSLWYIASTMNLESSGLCDRNSASRLLLEVDGPCAVGQLVLLQVFLVGNVDYARQDAELANPLVV